MTRGVAATALVLVTAATGCGYSNPRPEDQARATAETFVESCARDDPEGAREMLTRPLRARFSRLGSTARACARVLGVGSAELRRTRVAGVEVRGGHARVALGTPIGQGAPLDVGFSEGEWLVESPPR
jgi:hypothetical protein